MAAPAPRSLVASDVFTLVWGDCYFCAEPDNSIIHRGCWCTHFTSMRKGGGCVSHRVGLPTCAQACVRALKKTCADRRCTTDMPHHTEGGGRRREERRKGSCHKHGNQRDRRQEVRIKEREEKREGISSLIFSLSQLCSLESSSAQ